MRELTDKLSLVKSKCNLKDQEIRRLECQLNDYSKKLEEAQEKDSDSNGWTIPILGFTIGAEVGLAYVLGWKALAIVNGCGAFGCLVAWGLYRGYKYFFADVKPGVTKVNFVTESGSKNKTE